MSTIVSITEQVTKFLESTNQIPLMPILLELGELDHMIDRLSRFTQYA